jgi:inorganic triphosphatase YgiF
MAESQSSQLALEKGKVDALEAKYRELKEKHKRQRDTDKKALGESKERLQRNFEFQKLQLRDAVSAVREVKEANPEPLDEKVVKANGKHLTYEHLLHGAKGVALFLAFHVLVGRYRYNLSKRHFEYFSNSKKWKTDEGTKKFRAVIFSPLYPKCKEVYDKEMVTLEEGCHSGGKDEQTRFTEYRDRMRAVLDVVMSLGNGKDGANENSFLVEILQDLTEVLSFTP